MKPRGHHSTVFSAAPFDGVEGAMPGRQAGAPKPSLRASIGDRLVTPPPKPPHAPPKPEAWQRVDATEPPHDLAHAIEMREALKRRQQHIHGVLRQTSKSDPARERIVAQLLATQARLGELRRIVAKMTGDAHSRYDSVPIIGALLDVIDRAEDDGFPLTDRDRDALDLAAEFVAHLEEMAAVKKAVRRGMVPDAETIGVGRGASP